MILKPGTEPIHQVPSVCTSPSEGRRPFLDTERDSTLEPKPSCHFFSKPLHLWNVREKQHLQPWSQQLAVGIGRGCFYCLSISNKQHNVDRKGTQKEISNCRHPSKKTNFEDYVHLNSFILLTIWFMMSKYHNLNFKENYFQTSKVHLFYQWRLLHHLRQI